MDTMKVSRGEITSIAQNAENPEYKVWLNGVEQEGVVAANSEAGTVELLEVDYRTQMAIRNELGIPQTIQVKGVVKIEKIRKEGKEEENATISVQDNSGIIIFDMCGAPLSLSLLNQVCLLWEQTAEARGLPKRDLTFYWPRIWMDTFFTRMHGLPLPNLQVIYNYKRPDGSMRTVPLEEQDHPPDIIWLSNDPGFRSGHPSFTRYLTIRLINFT